MRNLKIWRKLAVLVLVLGIPISVLVVLFVQERDEQIDFTLKETYGVRYLISLRGLFERIPQHRDTANAFLNGNASARKQLLQLQAVIDGDVAVAQAMDDQYGGLLSTTERWDAVKRGWLDLKSGVLNLPAQQSFALHTRLIADVSDLMRQAADRSNLTLDTYLDTYYLQDALTVKIPQAAENMGVLRGLGAGIVARQQLQLSEQVRMSLLAGQAQLSKFPRAPTRRPWSPRKRSRTPNRVPRPWRKPSTARTASGSKSKRPPSGSNGSAKAPKKLARSCS